MAALPSCRDRDHHARQCAIGGALVALTLVVLAVPSLAAVPGRLIKGSAAWIAVAGVLQLLSMLSFAVVFKLVFGEQLTWRRSSLAALRALGAGAVLPAGGLVGPAAGARSAGPENASLSRLARSSIAFTAITGAPSVVVLAALGLTLWLGWPGGPHAAALTLVPAALALGVAAAYWRTGRSHAGAPTELGGARRRSARPQQLAKPLKALCDGTAESRALLVSGNWKLYGALGKYACDTALLWAAFRAYGPAPQLSVVVMGCLVGSLGAAIPTPAGVGGVEGGLFGALVLYGAPAAPTASAVLLYRGISLSVPLLLGVAAWICGPLASLRLSARPRRAGGPLGKRQPAGELTAASLD